jgi:hypothetical protein
LVSVEPYVFVIMPFKPELNYFFLYLRAHLHLKHSLACVRADQEMTTSSVHDKIVGQIRGAELVIADCTGGNPNVFYELGIARAFEKDVILITEGSMSDVPSDVRHFDFIKHDIAHYEEFLVRLDRAIVDISAGRYIKLYEAARETFEALKQQVPSVRQRSQEEFIRFIRATTSPAQTPAPDDRFAFAQFVVPAIVENSGDVAAMEQINDWLERLQFQ